MCLEIVLYKKLRCCRETARRFVSLNIALSYSRSLKVILNGTIRKLVYGFLFAFHSNYRATDGSIVTMALFCIMSEIKRDIGRKIFFIPSLHSVPTLSPYRLVRKKLEWCGYPIVTVWWYVKMVVKILGTVYLLFFVLSVNVGLFKSRLDKFWKDQNFIYNYNVDM